MEYKYKEEIIKAIPNTQLEVYSDLSDELNEVYAKAEAFDELSALIAKRYEAEKDRAGYTADQYTQGVYYTLNNLNGVAKDLESGDSEC